MIELKRANELRPEMPETLYSLGKAALLGGDGSTAEQSWLKVVELEKDTALAAQSHFGLAGLYRKQGKTARSSTPDAGIPEIARHYRAAPIRIILGDYSRVADHCGPNVGG